MPPENNFMDTAGMPILIESTVRPRERPIFEAGPRDYYLVTVPASGEATVIRMPELEYVANMIADLLAKNEKCQVFAFSGQQLQITKGPNSYLCTPGGRRIPCFQVPPPQTELLENGQLFTPPAPPEVDVKYAETTSGLEDSPIIDDESTPL